MEKLPAVGGDIPGIMLPHLRETDIDFTSAKVIIGAGPEGLEVPQLLIQSDEGGIRHQFSDGKLRLQEKRARLGRLGVQLDISIESGGKRYGTSKGRLVALMLPPNFRAVRYTINTGNGEVRMGGLMAQQLKVTTSAGAVSLEGARLHDLKIHSDGGNVSMRDVVASGGIAIATIVGDMNLRQSRANQWHLVSGTGDIVGRELYGNMRRAHSDVGEVDIQ